MNSELNQSNNSLLLKEFDKRARDIRIMSQGLEWFGIIFEAIMIIGIICSININDEVSNKIVYETGFSNYMLLGGYVAFVINMFIVPVVMLVLFLVSTGFADLIF